MKKERKNLREGFTTGAAAAAAAKACVTFILAKKKPSFVTIHFLSKGCRDIPVHRCTLQSENCASCEVIKDAGDDPDITHKAVIGATVHIDFKKTDGTIEILGGKGVGVVTRPGLEVSPHNPAINPGPQKMIRNEIKNVFSDQRCTYNAKVTVFVPMGEILARKTLNQRLGIIGGISILGTTGIERPLSHDAWIKTIEASFSVAKATGIQRVVLTTGRRSEKHAQRHLSHIPEAGFIQMGDFFKQSLGMAVSMGFKQITLVAFFAKALKMSEGIPHTHAAKKRLTLDHLITLTQKVHDDPDLIHTLKSANTARHAFEILSGCAKDVIDRVGEGMHRGAQNFASPETDIEAIIVDYDGEIVFRTSSGRSEAFDAPHKK